MRNNYVSDNGSKKYTTMLYLAQEGIRFSQDIIFFGYMFPSITNATNVSWRFENKGERFWLLIHGKAGTESMLPWVKNLIFNSTKGQALNLCWCENMVTSTKLKLQGNPQMQSLLILVCLFESQFSSGHHLLFRTITTIILHKVPYLLIWHNYN